MAALRLAFMGSPDFALPALDALRAAGHQIVAVYTQPPRPAGRGHQERRSAVHESAASYGLRVQTPASLKDRAVQDAFAALGVDAAVVAAYGLILPKSMLDAPRLGCLNVHASLLPRWRGAAPIQHAILAGDRESGVTIMRMDEGLDTGDILSREALAITAATTGGDLHDALAALGARLIGPALDGLNSGEIEPKAQPRDGVTRAPKFTSAERRLDWRRPAIELERSVRAFAPRPGAWLKARGERLAALAARVVEADAAAPGTVLDAEFTVACGEGALRLVRLRRAGKAETDAAALLRGFEIPSGTVLPPAGGGGS